MTAVLRALFIVAANSLFGFVGNIFHYDIDWAFLILLSALSVASIFIGSALSAKHKIKCFNSDLAASSRSASILPASS